MRAIYIAQPYRRVLSNGAIIHATHNVQTEGKCAVQLISLGFKHYVFVCGDVWPLFATNTLYGQVRNRRAHCNDAFCTCMCPWRCSSRKEVMHRHTQVFKHKWNHLYTYTVDFACVTCWRCMTSFHDEYLHRQARNDKAHFHDACRICPWRYLSPECATPRYMQTRNVQTQVKLTVPPDFSVLGRLPCVKVEVGRAYFSVYECTPGT